MSGQGFCLTISQGLAFDAILSETGKPGCVIETYGWRRLSPLQDLNSGTVSVTVAGTRSRVKQAHRLGVLCRPLTKGLRSGSFHRRSARMRFFAVRITPLSANQPLLFVANSV